MTAPFSPGGDLADPDAIAQVTPEDALEDAESSVLNRDTDRANAQEFNEMYRHQLLWTPEKGWHFYDGTRWRMDDVQYRNILMGKLADHMLMRSRLPIDDQERNILRARVKRLESHRGLTGALRYAESMMAKSITEMDQNPYLLNCPNGTFDTRSGERLDHNPAHYITRICPTDYDPGAVDPTWEKVWHEAFGDDKAKMEFFQRFIGYSLTGDYRMKAFMTLHGPSDAGKSTIVEPLHIVLGDVDEGGYVTTWDADVLQADSKVNRYEKLDKSRSARLILVGELEKGKRMADGFVKKFTGGNAMDAKALYKGSYTFKPRAKLILDTNYVAKSADPAVHNRLKLLSMTHVPREKNPLIKIHLESSVDAHRAILAWAMRGAKAWWDEQSLGAMPWLAAELAKFAKSSDALINFVDDVFTSCDVMSDCVPTKMAGTMYTAWCFEEGIKPMASRTFKDAMEERGHTIKRIPGGGAVVFTGVKVKGLDELSEMVRAAVISGKFVGSN